jgi:hypothetical protein
MSAGGAAGWVACMTVGIQDLEILKGFASLALTCAFSVKTARGVRMDLMSDDSGSISRTFILD